ncbi:HOG (high osmolarity glycerol) pathway protein [Mortierella alpina]|uniref:HOG (High osmolarity glycerol) pathway protein n=1 Tax=Mortierella alpina TaxID=64518 RepID=A0A9P6JCP7_MORAP|nr:HOG (high osmolarity glycerol) pathway protein [Mortierella alpina]
MALVSLPLCQSHTAGDAVGADGFLTKKRASVHYPEDSTMAKRMSLHFGPRCRSFSESWAFSAASTVPEFATTKDGSQASSSTLQASLAASKTSLKSVQSLAKATGCADTQETPDQKLIKTLASSLRGEGDDSKGFLVADRESLAPMPCDETKARSGSLFSAGPIEEDSHVRELVVTVRDFAYPKSHPYHLGQYPPEPEYEESDIEEDEEEDQEYSEVKDEDRTQGQARGLYDFDAENDTELSFREGDFVWIHCRQFPGWFLGEKDNKTGLVPENYVQLL